MKLRKFLSGISALCLTVVLLILTVFILTPTQVYAKNGSATTILTTTVPGTHSVQLKIGAHGLVSIDGVVYRGNVKIPVERLAKQEYSVQAEEGWQIASVMYDGKEQKPTSEKRIQLTFTAPAVNEDGHQLVVILKEDKPSSGGAGDTDTQDYKPGKSSVVKTDDTSNLLFYGVLLVLASGMILVLKRKYKRIYIIENV